MRPLFRTTDDCKPLDGGRRILISSSGGAVALIDRQTRRASFVARVTNAHSIEMLPGGRIAAAASVSTAGSGNRIVIFDAAGKELTSDELRSAHGVVWDESRERALGAWRRRAARLCRRRSRRLDDPRSPLRDRRCPIAAATTSCHSPVRRACSSAPSGAASISIAIGGSSRPTRRSAIVPTSSATTSTASTGRIVYVQAEGSNWWAEHLHFAQPEGTLRLPGEHLYKARWV